MSRKCGAQTAGLLARRLLQTFFLVLLIPTPAFAQSPCPTLNAELIDFTTTFDEDPGCFQLGNAGSWDGCESPVIQVSHTCTDDVTFEDVRDWKCDGSPCVELFPTGTIAERELPLPDDGITIDTTFDFWVGEDPIQITASYARSRELVDSGGGSSGDDGGCATNGRVVAAPLWLLALLLGAVGTRRVSLTQ